MKRIGEPWLPGRPYRDRPGVYVVAWRDGHLLTVLQDGELQLPGGGVDPGEQPAAALHREMREETGWTIAGPRRVASWQRYCYMPEYSLWARKVQSVYIARAIQRIGPPSEPDHLPVWISPRDATRLLDVEGDREVVRRLIASGTL